MTPSYNQAGFIEETIRSVLLQSYRNVEYIIMDGGSTDGSVDIIEKYAPWISYWESKPDRGQSHAINKGLEHASGSILAWINSDDCYPASALAKVAKHFLAHPEIDLTYGRCALMNENSVPVGERVGSIGSYSDVLDLWDVWWSSHNFVQPEVFWTRRIADRAGPVREDFYWVMDYEYWVRMFRAGAKVSFLDAELARFRLHADQKSTQPHLTEREFLSAVRPYIFAQDNLLSRAKRAELKGKWAYSAVFLEEVRTSLAGSESRLRRWWRLAQLPLRYPQLLLSRGFQERLRATLFAQQRG